MAGLKPGRLGDDGTTGLTPGLPGKVPPWQVTEPSLGKQERNGRQHPDLTAQSMGKAETHAVGKAETHAAEASKVTYKGFTGRRRITAPDWLPKGPGNEAQPSQRGGSNPGGLPAGGEPQENISK